MNLQEKMIAIQNELKAPKNLFNKFGKYSYRNAEGILESVKPLLAKHKVFLKLENEPVPVGDKFFLKCVATISNAEEANDFNCAVSYVEMDFNHAGMSAEQRGGCGISYGYKYLLNGLFLLDDNKDPDTDEYHEQTEPKKEDKKPEPKKEAPKPEPKKIDLISRENANTIIDLAVDNNIDLDEILKKNGFDDIYSLPAKFAAALYGRVKAEVLRRGNAQG